jgi:hypothetical protein
VKPLPEKGYGNFLSQKVPETNVEKSIGGTQNPYTFIGERKALAMRENKGFRFALREVIVLF